MEKEKELKIKVLDPKDLYLVELAARQVIKALVFFFPKLAFLAGGFWNLLAMKLLNYVLGYLVRLGVVKIDLKIIDTHTERDKEKFDKVHEVWDEITNAKGLSDEQKQKYRDEVIDAASDYVNIRDELRDNDEYS